ncbi:hypothetical protein JQ629_01380 [Bradyrhizobium sp. AUGA SZCCT0222]|uniref:pilus assembly protein TadG-related protein n=1 Tax=Bradyrhizobium sp. AUGA SZCCT0222 TaxID=2807668 RepID=UPI001BAABB26|nr:pilus assembly protein TadG-related protein [Bradyrhizobium sp. AUGA SZCCT0222]MBR1266154.1 hypothetical protein [Bradyrhizobium sp. AUGA SZCCT0222]
MRNMLRCRRGAAAFATVIAMVPLIGVVALGGEAGSWYVTKQHAQNAADAAAYSGALQQACLSAPGCVITNTVDYRAKQFAAQNAFCNAGDTNYPGGRCVTSPTGISHTVQIASLTSWNGVAGQFVQATVVQQQPAYLARVLGLTTVNIGATAVAAVQDHPAKPPCALALTGSISFQGSPNIIAPNCGMASNSTANNALNFTGGGMTMNLGSLSTAGGCTGQAQFCSPAHTHMPAVVNPFAVLDAVTIPTLPNCSGSNLVAYTAATPCKNNAYTLSGNTDVTLAGGVYFISGKLELKGNASLLGTGLFILLPGASFSMKGSGTIIMKGNTSVAPTQLPSVLQPYASLFANMSIYDRDTSPVRFGGTSQITFNGTMYLPNVDVTFQGNPTINGCGELIAKSIAFNGNATFDSTGCAASGAVTLPRNQYVRMVQ